MWAGSCKPWNDLTTNNELSNYIIELSVQIRGAHSENHLGGGVVNLLGTEF